MALKGLRIFKLALITLIAWTLLVTAVGNFTITIQPPIKIERVEEKLISPVPDATPTPTATHGAQIKVTTKVLAKEPTPVKVADSRELKGTASYYSRAGCLGCNENFIMANGQPLDDSALTLALTPEIVNEHKLLNDMVTIQNVKTGSTVKARVTDTGGFGRLGRVADLSVATRDALKCTSLCEVKIVFE